MRYSARLALAATVLAMPVALAMSNEPQMNADGRGLSGSPSTSTQESASPSTRSSAPAGGHDKQAGERQAIRELIARSFQMPPIVEQDHLAQMLNETEMLQYLVDRIDRFVDQYPDDPARPEFEIERMRAIYLGACLSGRPPRRLLAAVRDVTTEAPSAEVREMAEYWQLRHTLDRLHAQQALGHETRAQRHAMMVEFVDAHPDSAFSVRLLEALYESGIRANDVAIVEHALSTLRRHHANHVTTRTLEGRERLRRNIGSSWQPALRSLNGTPFDWNAARREVTLVVFWSAGHAPSVETLRRLSALRTDATGGRLSVVSIAIGGEIARTRAVLDEISLTATAAHDKDGWKSTLTRDFGIRTLPTLLVLDAGGVLRQIETPQDWTFDDNLPSLIERLLAAPIEGPAGAASQPTTP